MRQPGYLPREIYHASPQNSADRAMHVAQEIMKSDKDYTEIIALANGMLLATVLKAQLGINMQPLRVATDFRDGERMIPVILPIHKDGSRGNRILTVDVLRSTDELTLAKGEYSGADVATIYALDTVRDSAEFVGYVTDLDDVQMWYDPWPRS